MLSALTLADKMADPGEMAPISEAWRPGKDFSEPCNCPTSCGHRLPKMMRACSPDPALFDRVNLNGSPPSSKLARGRLREHLVSLLKVLCSYSLDDEPVSHSARSAASSISARSLSVSIATHPSVVEASTLLDETAETTVTKNSDADSGDMNMGSAGGAMDDSDAEVKG